jgi:hypothetical protein
MITMTNQLGLELELEQLGGVVVNYFPPTFGHLRVMTNARCLAIIQAYQIPGNFLNVEDRREAIAAFIGIREY